MALASVDETGMPDLRMVLLKQGTTPGLVFYNQFRERQGASCWRSRRPRAVPLEEPRRQVRSARPGVAK